MKKICILGASGNIGEQALISLKNRNDYKLVAISIGENIEFLEQFLVNNNCSFISVKKYEDYLKLKEKYPSINFYYGKEGLIKVIDESKAEYILNALSGFSGVLPSLHTLKTNKILLLANKETIVVAGELVNNYLKNDYGKIYPIDSEHAAIYKCFKYINHSDLDYIGLTCSGGPFFGYDKNKLNNVTLKDALNHPTFKMGKKITIDSSTLMNKAFEIVEAYYLFNVDINQIKVFIDRKSYVHSFVVTKDKHSILSVGQPTMLVPIKNALDLFIKPKEGFSDIEKDTFNNYQFYDVDYINFPLINYGYEIIKKKGNLGLIVNAANEVAVESFLNEKIKYFEISKIIDKIISISEFKNEINEKELDSLNEEVKTLTYKIIEQRNF